MTRRTARCKITAVFYVVHTLSILAMLLTVATLATAQQTTYNFVSVPFNTFNDTSCPPVCRVTGYMTVPNPFPANLVGNIGASGDFLPTAFTFADGLTTWNDQNVPLQLGSTAGFAVDTDATGNITFFSYYLQGSTGYLSVYSGNSGENEVYEYSSLGNYSADVQIQAPTPVGFWTTGVPTPEPGTISL